MPKTLDCVLLDFDLYKAYSDVLPVVWPLLRDGGAIYLDEYFSYKFPGARIAVDEFLLSHNKDAYSLVKVSEMVISIDIYFLKEITFNQLELPETGNHIECNKSQK